MQLNVVLVLWCACTSWLLWAPSTGFSSYVTILEMNVAAEIVGPIGGVTLPYGI